MTPKPPPKDEQKKDGDWDDMLGEDQQSGISPEMARTLLSMNPKLRDEGKNTAWVVASGQKASHQGAQKQKTAAAAPPPKPAAGDVFTELDSLKRKLDLEEQRLDAEMKELQAQKTRAKQDALDALMRLLATKDPEMLSPMTQQALADKKAFLDKLGFSVKGFVEFKRKLGAK